MNSTHLHVVGTACLLHGLHLACMCVCVAGLGDKKVLRRALLLLGLPEAAGRVKRAIQFGSRIGKFSNTRDFGSNRRANKHSAGSMALAAVPGARKSGDL